MAMDQRCLVCRFVGLLLSVVSLTQSSSITGIITPTTPSAFILRNITLNCTLQGNITNDRSAQNVSFAFTNDDVKSKAHTQVIDDNTVKLTITGVYVNMSSSRISCCLGNDTLDEVSIVVDDPRFPNSTYTKCVVYDWASMTCTWDLEDTTNVSISMAYRRTNSIGRCSGGRFLCPKPIEYRGQRGGCSWPSYLEHHDPFQLTDHCVSFSAKNAYGDVAYGPLRFLTVKTIVKPNKVSFNVVNHTSNHIELGWAVHPSGKSIRYRVTYWSRFSTTAVQNTSGTSMMLYNLIPNTNYTIAIDCIPLVLRKSGYAAIGFWSDKETVHFATKSDVPGDSPSVTAGGYLVSERNATHRIVKLFFQPVADILSHGKVMGYRVRYSTGNSTIQSQLPSLVTTVDLSLEMEKTYVVSVEMKNNEGYNKSLALETVVIDRQSEVPPFPENFVVQTDGKDEYILNWTEVDNASSYTVYWCSSNIRTFECKSELKWKVVQANQTSEVLLDVVADPGLLLRFALSVERVTTAAAGQTVSSGMFVANCTYSTKGELKPPESVKVMRSTASTIIVDFMRPDRSVSSENNCNGIAYAAQYLITYCSLGQCGEMDKIFNLTVESFRDSVTINGLNAEETYDIRIWSVSENGESSIAPAALSVLKYTADKPPVERPFPTVVVAVLVVVSLAAICAVPGIVKCVGYLKKRLHIEVKTPPKYFNTNQASPTAETTGYSTFLQTNLSSGGQFQTTVSKFAHNNRPLHGYFNSGSIQPSEDENLLSRHNSENKSSTSSSSEMSSMPSSTQSNSVSSNSSSDPRRDSGISAVSISGYNVVIEQPSDTSASSSGGFPIVIVPCDENAIATTEIV